MRHYQYDKDFEKRKGLNSQWVLILGTEGRGITLKDMCGYGGDSLGKEITSAGGIRNGVIAPVLIPCYALRLGTACTCHSIKTALVLNYDGGSELNRLAVSIANLEEVFGVEDSLPGCFALTGPAVLFKQKGNGRLTTFSKTEALEAACAITDTISSEDWYAYAVKKAWDAHNQKNV